MKTVQVLSGIVGSAVLALLLASEARAQINFGPNNTIVGPYSSVAAGNSNANNASHAIIGGGLRNVVTAAAHHSFIGGGTDNYASSPLSGIGVGYANTASGANGSFIGGGELNANDGAASFIGCGGANILNSAASLSFIGAGDANQSSGYESVIGGGTGNTIGSGANYSFIGGGGYSVNNGLSGVLVGGQLNQIGSGGSYSFLGGGAGNIIQAAQAVVNGGSINTVQSSATYGTIGGGLQNTNNASYTTIGGGNFNLASAQYSTVPGGYGAKTISYGQTAHANGFFSVQGDAQTALYVLRRTTTGASQTELYLDGVSAQMQMPPKTTWWADIMVVGYRVDYTQIGYYHTSAFWISDSAGSVTASLEVPIKYNGCNGLGGCTIQTTRMAEYESQTSWDVLVGGSGSPSKPAVFVKGSSTQNVRWVAVVRVVQVSLD